MVPYDRVPLYHKLYPNAYIMIVCMHLDLLWQLLTGIEEKIFTVHSKGQSFAYDFCLSDWYLQASPQTACDINSGHDLQNPSLIGSLTTQ